MAMRTSATRGAVPEIYPAEPRWVKSSIDVALAALALILLSPLLAIVALLVRLDSNGPVLFKQTRNGRNGRPFKIYKFRTMTVLEDGPVVQQARRGDKRVTRVGAWLRRTSIDELPQLLNVLKGDMSLVGPRPHAVAHDDEYGRVIQNYALRHTVKPGITGWAQVNGSRGETPTIADMQRRIEFDVWYVRNWRPLLDLVIILRTVVELTRDRSVY